MGLGPEQRGALSLIKMPRPNRRLLIGPHANKTFGSKKGGGKRPRSKYVGRWADGISQRSGIRGKGRAIVASSGSWEFGRVASHARSLFFFPRRLEPAEVVWVM
ncbi:hypothetical protein TEQG_00676 [Trichophyton equinum CBS 127.97]|uniref:Uncharacterized protein n=1 Tax=Trichophyton equinum (strain ATCC MYA-4606 / CBS 127.97) TaxID=559882 RepID=F2PI68_TRIEC|nr:hypothetical protein TEQG_00676 [Trichophyton equinum CBS 127.97]